MRIPEGDVSQAQGTAGTVALRQQRAGERDALVKSRVRVIATICIYIVLHPVVIDTLLLGERMPKCFPVLISR